MRLRYLTPIAAACLLLGAATARADTLNLTGYTFGGPATVAVSSPNYSGGAGEFTGTYGPDANPLNNPSFTTYCTDLLQSFAFNTVYTDYVFQSGVSAWGATKANDLGRLVTGYRSAAFVNDSTSSAAFQLAVWEIIYEVQTPYYSLADGSFKDTTSAAALLATGWLSDLPNTSKVTVDKLLSREHQDFMVTTPVPEPSTFALLLAGLASVGFVARRRSRSI